MCAVYVRKLELNATSFGLRLQARAAGASTVVKRIQRASSAGPRESVVDDRVYQDPPSRTSTLHR